MIQHRLLPIPLFVCLFTATAAPQTAVNTRLSEYRVQIDAVDQQIVELLNKRAAIVQKIGTVKKEAGIPVAAPARELQVVDHVVQVGQPGPLPTAAVRRIYEVILREMRSWEASGSQDKH